MKIAIRGHASRGHEVIQILESLGGKNPHDFRGDCIQGYYSISNNIIIYFHNTKRVENTKLYTLEEFEKEFPFKIGDKVITDNSCIGVIEELVPNYISPYCIRADDGIFYWYVTFALKPYKEMKEERNITLTLDKAKEWYKKGGELKEIALQAFTEKELTKVDLPKTWEEFCGNYPIKEGESYVGDSSEIYTYYEYNGERDSELDRNMCPTPKSAEAHLALIQLEQLRNCWRQGWEPTPGESYYVIKLGFRGLDVYRFCTVEFLSFPTREMAEEFLKCFRDLIKKAGDLI